MTATRYTVENTAVCLRSLELMATGTAKEFAEVYDPDAKNREAKDEPAAARTGGPEGFYATALWLREAYSQLHWEVHDAVAQDELVVLYTTMSGRHTGPFTTYTDTGSVAVVFPPRNRAFAVTQTHWFRMRHGRIVEHWANRDDLTQGQQLGWTPPTPAYLARMLLAKRRTRQKIGR